jgi:hypothetical protein
MNLGTVQIADKRIWDIPDYHEDTVSAYDMIVYALAVFREWYHAK